MKIAPQVKPPVFSLFFLPLLLALILISSKPTKTRPAPCPFLTIHRQTRDDNTKLDARPIRGAKAVALAKWICLKAAPRPHQVPPCALLRWPFCHPRQGHQVQAKVWGEAEVTGLYCCHHLRALLLHLLSPSRPWRRLRTRAAHHAGEVGAAEAVRTVPWVLCVSVVVVAMLTTTMRRSNAPNQ